MMTSSDLEARVRFGELVKLHMRGRRFLDREQERRLLEEGILRYNLRLDDASAIVRAAAEHDEIAMEGELSRSSSQLLKTLADRHGRVSRDDFYKAVAFYRARAGAGLSETKAARRVKQQMEDLDLKPRPSGRPLPTRRWYKAIDA